MPFWNRNPQDPQQKAEAAKRQQQADQDAQESMRLLSAGGLPLQATRRLQQETAAGHELFTSDLSVNEFLMAREQGYVALSQVMGSSIYHVGWQYGMQGAWYTTSFELTTISQAHQHAAMLALGRMEQEASMLRAHGVIGVRLATRNYEWGANMIEYTAIGTAIRLPNAPLTERPFLSDLSGQEFWTLLQAGYYPIGISTGYCSYYVCGGARAQWQTSSWYNQEVEVFTRGIYAARHLAMERVSGMARQLNGAGVVGMHLNHYEREIEYERNDISYRDLMVHFAGTGTIITNQRPNHVIPQPTQVLMLNDVRPGHKGETRELTER